LTARGRDGLIGGERTDPEQAPDHERDHARTTCTPTSTTPWRRRKTARVEQALRSSEALRQSLRKVMQERDRGEHSLGAIWRRER